MKKLSVFLCLFFCVTALYARSIREEYREADEKAKVSYAIGMLIASNFDLSTLGLEINYDAFTDGLRAVMQYNNPQFTFQEASEILETALYNVTEKAAQENYQIEQEFLQTNGSRPGVQITPSGLQYVVLRDAEGEKPSINSVVRVHYTGIFTDGSIFDRSDDEEGVYVPLDMVIPGWSEGVMLMSVGGLYRFYIPSNLAYGRDGAQGFIPPYSTLVFTIELLEITDEFNLEY